jgi:hypothetical protein
MELVSSKITIYRVPFEFDVLFAVVFGSGVVEIVVDVKSDVVDDSVISELVVDDNRSDVVEMVDCNEIKSNVDEIIAFGVVVLIFDVE